MAGTHPQSLHREGGIFHSPGLDVDLADTRAIVKDLADTRAFPSHT